MFREATEGKGKKFASSVRPCIVFREVTEGKEKKFDFSVLTDIYCYSEDYVKGEEKPAFPITTRLLNLGMQHASLSGDLRGKWRESQNSPVTTLLY